MRERVAVLRRLHDIVLAEQDTILDIVQTETGKSRAHAFDEVADVARSTCCTGRRVWSR
ncbi:succinate-semialdehyde dehydrogenase [Mycobacteroides abscessus subsp. abscessus]|nr:succinate-semialdehyde dehydrogenase [Mycobacteroides abscessus subsp. abscessus]